jgi:hypothetical protein
MNSPMLIAAAGRWGVRQAAFTNMNAAATWPVDTAAVEDNHVQARANTDLRAVVIRQLLEEPRRLDKPDQIAVLHRLAQAPRLAPDFFFFWRRGEEENGSQVATSKEVASPAL